MGVDDPLHQGGITMLDALDFLSEHAELKIFLFDVSSRVEMKTFNRTRPHYVMSYHKQGSAKLRVGQETYSITPGTVICIPPNVEHDHYKETDEETVFLWWHIKYEIGNVIDVLRLFQIPLVYQLKDASHFERVFGEFMESSSNKGPWPSTILKKAKALELLYLLLADMDTVEHYGFSNSQTQSFLGILVQIIQQPEKELSLKALSDQFYLHPTYISNRFKELFGKSPIHMHREMRIHQAKRLLGSSELSISSVAEAAGFNGVSSFSRLFHMYVGLSPSQYRDLNKLWGES